MKKYQNMEKKTEKKVEKKKDTKKTLFQIACEAMSWSSKAEEEGSAEVAAQNAEKVYKLFGKESIMENQSQKETEEWNTSLFEVKDKEEVEKDMEKKKRLIKEDCVTTLKMLSSFYDCLPKQVTKGEVGMTENNWDSLKTFASSLEDSLSEFSVFPCLL